MRKYIEFILNAWKPYKKKAVLIFILTIFNTCAVLFYPYILRYIINGMQENIDMNALKNYILMLLLSGVIIAVIYTFLQSNRLKMNLTFSNTIRENTFNRFPNYGSNFFNKYDSGDISTRLMHDLEGLSWFLSSGIFRGLEGGLLIITGIFFMVRINVILPFIILLPLVLIIVILILTTQKMLSAKYRKVQDSVSLINDFLNNSFSGIISLKVQNKNETFIGMLGNALFKRRDNEINAVKAERAVDSLYQLAIVFCITAFLIIGGHFAISGKIRLGDFVAFITYLIILIGPMFMIGYFVIRFAMSRASIDRLIEIRSGEHFEKRKREKEAELKESITLKNVTHSDGENLLLDNINIEILKGEKIGIVGDVGSGKTLLVKSIMGLVEVNGEINIDDIPVSEISRGSLSKIFGYAPQESVLFSESIVDNIIFSQDMVNQESLEKTIKIAQFEKDIENFNINIEEKRHTSKTVSGGQMQRISIARAIVLNHTVYVFDDITSYLDPETEYALINELKKELKDKTVIMISYRPYTLSQMDIIYLMRQGRIIDTGTHSELLKNNEYYKELLLLQK